MSKVSHKLYTAEQVRAMDKYAINELGMSGTVLMERAGASAFELLKQRWPEAKTISIVCGTGNNAGDGYVVARLAKQAGFSVHVLQLSDAASLKGDALAAAQRLLAMDVSPVEFDIALCQQADLIVDAILGTGIEGDVSGERHDAIKLINELNKPVLALDIPSGLNANNGSVQGIAIKASATVTFIGNKQGLYAADAYDHCGELMFASLNVPDEVYAQQQSDVSLMYYASLKALLKPRPRNSHKGDFGHVLVVGGESGYTGAPRMAAEAAARTGAGLVSIATRHEHASVLNVSRPELMVHGVDDEKAFQILAEKSSVIAIGPGLGQSRWAKNLLGFAIDTELPMIVDADALNLLSSDPQKKNNWILTPHVGEAARLLGQSTAEVQSDRFAAARNLQKEYGGIVILKGAGTVVRLANGMQFICPEGNPGMASGGMGDVLTGVIAGLIAQGLSRADAARLGVCLHAHSGDAAVKAAGQRGLLAGDLMSWVRRFVNP